MIIGLSGYGGCGKDTVADILVEDHGFVKYAWADTLRLAASALNPIVDWSDGSGGAIRYNDAVEQYGYNEAKFKFPEVREILQRLGTEVGRDLIGTNVWVDATLARIERENPNSHVVIADTRFPNEFDQIVDSYGYVIRVNRPGVGPAGDHPSETSLDDHDFDFTIDNSGSIDDLRHDVAKVWEQIQVDY